MQNQSCSQYYIIKIAMVVGLIVDGALAGAAVGAAALGVGMPAAAKVGSAYGKTVHEMYDEQRVADYYNQQAYYQHAGRSRHHGYYPSSSGHHYYYYGSRY